MDLNVNMTDGDRANAALQATAVNKLLNPAKGNNFQVMGKDDFLKLFMAELQNQDPTAPMQDKEFIAQMAQFSSLEQITNMSNEFSKLSNVMTGNQALQLIGKTVQVAEGQQVIVGKVEEVKGREIPLLLINGKYYDLKQIQSVKE